MWEMIEARLGDANPAVRLEGWEMLRRGWQTRAFVPQQEHFVKLGQSVWGERVPDVWRCAVGTLSVLGARAAFEKMAPAPDHSGAGGDTNEEPTLADWLWAPFKGPSAAFGLLDPKHRQRDELAKLVLARHLAFTDFPQATFHLVHLGDPKLGELLYDQRYGAVCLIGRLSLYGDEALQRWTNPEARFAFPAYQRPEEQPGGTLDRNYHYILDRNNGGNGGGRAGRYITREDKGKRTDYGLVQRYLVHDGVRDLVVVTCAGASSLGTLAAVQWAAVDLLRPLHQGGDLLPAPGWADFDTHLEALLEVTADVTDYNWEWKPSQMKVLRLSLDRAFWSQEKHGWAVEAPGRITVVRVVGEPAAVADILFDNKQAPLRKNSRMFRLLGSLCLRAAASSSRAVDLGELRQDAGVWGEEGTVPERTVRRHLTQLKFRYLGEALEMGRTIVLHRPVTVQ
jgi:hypothetical protein